MAEAQAGQPAPGGPVLVVAGGQPHGVRKVQAEGLDGKGLPGGQGQVGPPSQGGERPHKAEQAEGDTVRQLRIEPEKDGPERAVDHAGGCLPGHRIIAHRSAWLKPPRGASAARDCHGHEWRMQGARPTG